MSFRYNSSVPYDTLPCSLMESRSMQWTITMTFSGRWIWSRYPDTHKHTQAIDRTWTFYFKQHGSIPSSLYVDVHPALSTTHRINKIVPRTLGRNFSPIWLNSRIYYYSSQNRLGPGILRQNILADRTARSIWSANGSMMSPVSL